MKPRCRHRKRRFVATLLAGMAALFALPMLALSVRSDEADANVATAAELLELVIDIDVESAQKSLATLTGLARSRQISPAQIESLKARLGPKIAAILSMQPDHPLRFEGAMLATSWGDAAGMRVAREILANEKEAIDRRVMALEGLGKSGDSSALATVGKALRGKETSAEAQGALLMGLASFESPAIADEVLVTYRGLKAEAQPKAIELLTRRPVWSKALMRAMAAGAIPVAAVSANQASRMLEMRDEELKKLVATAWGTLRTERDRGREQVVESVRAMLERTKGDPARGEVLFGRLCGQCHKIYDQGAEVGPDITVNGRASFAQLLSNILDPNLVIGPGYMARTITTVDGETLTGLVVEENEQRIAVKMQVGKIAVFPRSEVERVSEGGLSLMPEGIEKQYTSQELADLIAFLVLDKKPGDPTAKKISGTPEHP